MGGLFEVYLGALPTEAPTSACLFALMVLLLDSWDVGS